MIFFLFFAFLVHKIKDGFKITEFSLFFGLLFNVFLAFFFLEFFVF